MLQSKLFTKTRKSAPKDEVSKNAELLIRAGFVYKEMAGVYAYLPLGIKVLENIKTIVREEMNSIGGEEIIMTSLQRKEIWENTKRWNDEAVDVWFKSQLKNGVEVGFGWSHEEPITEMMKEYITSYRDLPVYVYQFQTKLRNELRAKSGIMRGREFVMKDLYSYTTDEEMHERFYQSVIDAYTRVFARVGVGNDTFVTFASGGAFTQFSHEFQTICDAGEDQIYINREKNIAINEEVFNDETLKNLGVTRDELECVKTAEVGNIFNFGRKKCEDIGLFFQKQDESKEAVWLGSYGIGITRLMGVIVEKFADDKGIVWPKSVAPFQVHLLSLGVNEKAQEIYETLTGKGIQVLYDERDKGAGEKFADADLIGIPKQIIIGKRSLESGNVELKDRASGMIEEVAFADLVNHFA